MMHRRGGGHTLIQEGRMCGGWEVRAKGAHTDPKREEKGVCWVWRLGVGWDVVGTRGGGRRVGKVLTVVR